MPVRTPKEASLGQKKKMFVVRTVPEGSESSKNMAAGCLTILTEQWIRDRLQLKHPCLGDVRSLSLPGTFEEKIRHLGKALNNFVRLKSLDLSCNALVSVQGVQHLKMLERLILYNNCIPSLEEVEVLFELKALKELDLRLNPLTKNYPHYRPYLVHAMPSLRKLDSCSVRDTERKAAMLQFSSDILPQQKSSSLNPTEDQRSSNQRLALVNRLTKRLSLLTDSQDIVLNFVETNHRGRSETVSFHKEAEELKDSEDFTQQRSSTPKQETGKSILRYPPTKNDNTESKGPQVKEPSHNKTSTSAKVSERPKVSFGPYIEKTVSGKQKQKDLSKQTRHAAKGHFTPNPDQSQHHSSSFSNIRPPSPRRPGLNLSDPSNPILHPPRLTYSSFNKTEEGSSLPQQGDKKKRGSYRKPLEMLLNLVDRHWTGERSLHHNNNFLSQAVQILSMMESDISSREAEVRTLRREADTLSFQAAAREEEHKSEVRNLSAQLEEARRAVGTLNEQLRIVLEENVALQKQLIKLERQYLKSMMKSSPITQIREAQTEVEELRKEIEGLRKKVQEAENVKELSNMLQESHRSLVATNECLLAELKGSGEH
ncbi:centrosomal protein of 72 kDa isoform X2 [Amphiprion ocellaris]|uniref:centrosomal protein of 72 kDa isoform X2 n=1 Tax=Amphiprion ocellaris TaxID=80972 RepID=UPI002410E714|nr:centrosomal protein of 72 kDa isoform X2 [Amphiprion ocellaris]